MTETELERLVIKIVGDDSSFQKMVDQVAAKLVKVQQATQEVTQAEREKENAMRSGAAIIRQNETAVERYNRALQETNDILEKGGFGKKNSKAALEQFHREMEKHKELLPEFAKATEDQAKRAAKSAEIVAKAERDKAKAVQDAAMVKRSMQTPEQNFQQTQGRLRGLVRDGGLSMEDYNKAVEMARQQLPDVVAASQKAAQAEREKQAAMTAGQQIIQSNMTDTERYAAAVDRLNKIMAASGGKFTRKDYYKELENLDKMLPENQKKQQTQARADNIAQRVATPQEMYDAHMKELNEVYKNSTMSVETFQRASEQAKKTLEASKAPADTLSTSMQSLGMGLTAAGVAITGVGALMTRSLMSWGNQAIDSAKTFEQTMVSFGAYLGSEKKAADLLGEMTVLSAKTPFEMPTLLSASKMMLQFGVATEKVLPMLKSIGDVTGGSDPHKVQQMAYAFSQMSSAGRLMGQDLMQMVNAGFNPLNEMSKTTKKSLAQLRQEMSDGKISADMVMAAFESASGKLNLMEKQSDTLDGRISTLNDNIGLMFRDIGTQLSPIYGKWVDLKASLVGWFRQLDPEVKKAIAYVGMFTAAIGVGITSLGGFLVIAGGAALAMAALGTQTNINSVVTAINTATRLTASAAMSLFSIQTWVSVASLVASKYALIAHTVATVTAGIATKTFAVGVGILAFALNAEKLGMVYSTVATWLGAAAKAAYALVTGAATAATYSFIMATVAGTAVLAVAAVGVYMLAKAYWDLSKAIELSSDLSDRVIEGHQKRFKSSISAAKELPDISSQVSYLTEMQDSVKLNRDGVSQRINVDEKKLKSPTLGTADKKVLESQIANDKKLLKEYESQLNELDSTITESQGQTALKKKIEATTVLLASQEDQLKSTQSRIKEMDARAAKGPRSLDTSKIDAMRKSAEELGKVVDATKDKLTDLEKRAKIKMTPEMEKYLAETKKATSDMGLKDTEVLIKRGKELKSSPEALAEVELVGNQKSIKDAEVALKGMKEKNDVMVKYGQQSAEMLKVIEAEIAVNKNLTMTDEQRKESLEKILQAKKGIVEQEQIGANLTAKEELRVLKEQGLAIQMNTRDAEIYLMVMQSRGKLSRELAEMVVDQKHANEFDKMTKSLEQQANMLRMTADEAARYKLEISGLSETQAANIAAQEKTNKRLEQWKGLTEKHLSPQERFAKAKKELDEMFQAAGDTSPKAAQIYQKELNDLQKQADRAGGAIRKALTIDATETGSAEAFARINEYMSLAGSSDLNAPIPDVLDPPKVEKAGQAFGQAAVKPLESMAERLGQAFGQAAVKPLESMAERLKSLMGVTGEQLKMSKVPEGLIPPSQVSQLPKEANFDPMEKMAGALDYFRDGLHRVNLEDGGVSNDVISRIFAGMEEHGNVSDAAGQRLSYDTTSANLITAMERAKELVNATQSELSEQYRLKGLPNRSDTQTGEEFSAKETNELERKLQNYKQLYANFSTVTPLLRSAEGKDGSAQPPILPGVKELPDTPLEAPPQLYKPRTVDSDDRANMLAETMRRVDLKDRARHIPKETQIPPELSDRAKESMDVMKKGGKPIELSDRAKESMDVMKKGGKPIELSDRAKASMEVMKKGAKPIDLSDKAKASMEVMRAGGKRIELSDKAKASMDVMRSGSRPIELSDRAREIMGRINAEKLKPDTALEPQFALNDSESVKWRADQMKSLTKVESLPEELANPFLKTMPGISDVPGIQQNVDRIASDLPDPLAVTQKVARTTDDLGGLPDIVQNVDRNTVNDLGGLPDIVQNVDRKMPTVPTVLAEMKPIKSYDQAEIFAANQQRLKEAEKAREYAEEQARRAGLDEEQISTFGDDVWAKSERESAQRWKEWSIRKEPDTVEVTGNTDWESILGRFDKLIALGEKQLTKEPVMLQGAGLR